MDIIQIVEQQKQEARFTAKMASHERSHLRSWDGIGLAAEKIPANTLFLDVCLFRSIEGIWTGLGVCCLRNGIGEVVGPYETVPLPPGRK